MPWRLGESLFLIVALLTACAGDNGPATPTAIPRAPVNPIGGTPSALQTSIALVTASAATPPGAAQAPGGMGSGSGANSATIAAGAGAAMRGDATAISPVSGGPSAAGTAGTAGTAMSPAGGPRTASPVPVTNAPSLPADAVAGSTIYTNPAMTFRFAVPPGWSPPMPSGPPAPPTRVVTRSPGGGITLAVEEDTPPDDWPRLPPANVAGLLDAAYRFANPGATLQTAVVTGVRGEGSLGLSTYRFTYTAGGATTERFVVLTSAGSIVVTATGTPDAITMARGTVEGIAGSLMSLKRDAPTPAALVPVGATTAPTGTMRTPSGLTLALPAGWKIAPVPMPMQPPGTEFAATSADGQQAVRVLRKPVGGGVTLDDFAATAAVEFRAAAMGYDVDDEGENRVSGQRAVRVLYSAVVGGRPVQGQSVALLKDGAGYVVMVELPAAQYATDEAAARALFDRIGGSVVLP